MSPSAANAHAPMPGAEGLAEPLRSRWSPSVFDDRHRLGADELAELLHAAQWSPSAGNTQPWAFFVAERGNATHRVVVEHLSRGNSGWVPRASVVLVAAVQVEPDAEGNGGGDATLYDLGQAAAHVTLQARAMGLHAHQFAGFDTDAVHAALGVPAHYRVLTGIAIGVRGSHDEVDERTSAREDRVRVRKPLESFVFDGVWGTPWTAPGADRPAGSAEGAAP
ncbi:nitroreductase family protein [Nocardioides sp.]|uniref:nitroreductase family protein n=1 Tax=Nocardioides sp. TaxID=35761 RepID=UPI00356262FA